MPASSGPIAARTTRTLATSSPSGVAISTEARKPRMPRWTEVQAIAQISPLSSTLANSCHTEAGEGSLYSGQNAAAHRTCHSASARPSATSGGTPARSARPASGGRLVVGVSSASRPAPTAASDPVAGVPSPEPAGAVSITSLDMGSGVRVVGDHRAQPVGDLDGQGVPVGLLAEAP